MLFMVIERFKNRDAEPVYRRFREQGRMMPEGLKYVASWIEENFDRCFQVMECEDPTIIRAVDRRSGATWWTSKLCRWFLPRRRRRNSQRKGIERRSENHAVK